MLVRVVVQSSERDPKTQNMKTLKARPDPNSWEVTSKEERLIDNLTRLRLHVLKIRRVMAWPVGGALGEISRVNFFR